MCLATLLVIARGLRRHQHPTASRGGGWRARNYRNAQETSASRNKDMIRMYSSEPICFLKMYSSEPICFLNRSHNCATPCADHIAQFSATPCADHIAKIINKITEALKYTPPPRIPQIVSYHRSCCIMHSVVSNLVPT